MVRTEIYIIKVFIFRTALHLQEKKCECSADGSLMQMGSQNTHLVEEDCTTRGPPKSSRRKFWFSGCHFIILIPVPL